MKAALTVVAMFIGTTGHAETITVAGGCFWCTEADFEKVQGVSEAVSGFAGGDVPDPSYDQVVSGGTGHYEAVQVSYDPDVIDRRQLYDLFFRSIDPLDDGGQFCDRGDSYRTAIWVDGPDDTAAAEAAKAAAEAELNQSIVTPILDDAAFYPAEAYHQDYYKSQDRLPFSTVGIAVKKETAYDRYRARCGRDERIRELWGDDAPFLPPS
ncbi:peptide-methionine (S)-S-oxide reductase MsrA [Loktanella sp. DJP18]|uniref:peptide-methionine (S)-S-oxide reductase MsrA n=1 Tax=Loktanella sp. DJP18 TaxID=3409788 RepID=UPI003BB51570